VDRGQVNLKKGLLVFVCIYIVYVVGILVYFHTQNSLQVPSSYIGTPADPKTFLKPAQIQKAIKFSTITNSAYFLIMPLKWMIYFLLFSTGFSAFLKDKTNFRYLRIPLFIIGFYLVLFLCTLPFSVFYYLIDRQYGLVVQSVFPWLADEIKSLGISMILYVPIYWLLYWLIEKKPIKWWIYIWSLSIPIIVFFLFVQPVLLDPLLNKFIPLQDQTLRREIITLTQKAGIPTKNIYQVDKSKETNEINAYVTGIGSNMRIVLWDTTLKRMDRGEILFVTAHEMGHYVKKHIYWGILFAVIGGFFGVYVFYRFYRWIAHRFGYEQQDISLFPLALLLVSLFMFFSSPVENAISREIEHQADQYGLQLSGDKNSAVRSFQQFARDDLSDVNPPFLVYVFLTDHPTILQRISFAESYKQK
jgi:STE24 endopeptidase